jgi:hypothetical protein
MQPKSRNQQQKQQNGSRGAGNQEISVCSRIGKRHRQIITPAVGGGLRLAPRQQEGAELTPEASRQVHHNPVSIEALFDRARTEWVLHELLQKSFQLADMRQGTTSVVPQLAYPDSGFSRCGFTND